MSQKLFQQVQRLEMRVKQLEDALNLTQDSLRHAIDTITVANVRLEKLETKPRRGRPPQGKNMDNQPHG